VIILVHLLLVLGLFPVGYHLVNLRFTDGVKVGMSQAVHGGKALLRIQSEHAIEDGDALLGHFAYIFAV
jgi:hypothetical protein